MTNELQAIIAEIRELESAARMRCKNYDTISDNSAASLALAKATAYCECADRLESLAPASGGAIKARVSQIEDAIAVGSMTSAQVFMIGLMLMMNGSLD